MVGNTLISNAAGITLDQVLLDILQQAHFVVASAFQAQRSTNTHQSFVAVDRLW